MTFDLPAAGSAASPGAIAPCGRLRDQVGKDAGAGSAGPRTADSPFAILLESAAVPERAAGLAPAADLAAVPARAPVALLPSRAAPVAAGGPLAESTRAPLPVLDPSFGTPAPGLEAGPLAAATAALTPRRQAAVAPVTDASSSDEPGVNESHPQPAAPSLPTELGTGDLSSTQAQQAAGVVQAAATATPAATPTATPTPTRTANATATPTSAAVPMSHAAPMAHAVPQSYATSGPATAWRAADRETSATASAPQSSRPQEPTAAAAAQAAAPVASRAAQAAASRRGDQRGAATDPGVAAPPAAEQRHGGRWATAAAASATAAPSAVAGERVATRRLATGARLDQAARAGKLSEERTPAQRTEARPARQPDPAVSQQPQAAARATPEAPAPGTPAKAAPAGPPTPALPPELPQTALSGAILPGAAHLRLESETLGDLSLHLRVREGVAHVRVEGEQAAQLAGRAPELQRALAAEGLTLGTLEVERPTAAPAPAGETARGGADSAGLPQRQSSGRDGQPEAPPTPGPAAAAAPTRAAGRSTPSGRATAHHVEA